jgi:hypothetical protein
MLGTCGSLSAYILALSCLFSGFSARCCSYSLRCVRQPYLGLAGVRRIAVPEDRRTWQKHGYQEIQVHQGATRRSVNMGFDGTHEHDRCGTTARGSEDLFVDRIFSWAPEHHSNTHYKKHGLSHNSGKRTQPARYPPCPAPDPPPPQRQPTRTTTRVA